MSQEAVVAALHQWCHPTEGEHREDVSVFVGAFIIVTQGIVVAQALLHQPLQSKLDRGQANTGSEDREVCDVLLVQLLGNERTKLHTIGDEEEQPVNEDDTVGIARAPVLNVLNVEDDEERRDGGGGGPEAEVSRPNASKVLNLEGGLNGGCCNKGSENTLYGVCSQWGFFRVFVTCSLPVWHRSASSA